MILNSKVVICESTMYKRHTHIFTLTCQLFCRQQSPKLPPLPPLLPNFLALCCRRKKNLAKLDEQNLLFLPPMTKKSG